MKDFLIYTGVFLTATVLQLFVADPVQLWIYLSPLVYVAFVVLLPMNTRPVVVLLSGLVTGLVMDFFTGMGGLHTVVTLFMAYIRRLVMLFSIGKEYSDEGAMPSVKSLGYAKFMRYATLMVTMHCLLYFALEALTWKYFHVVLIKTVVSGAATMLGVWLVSMLFTVGTPQKN